MLGDTCCPALLHWGICLGIPIWFSFHQPFPAEQRRAQSTANSCPGLTTNTSPEHSQEGMKDPSLSTMQNQIGFFHRAPRHKNKSCFKQRCQVSYCSPEHPEEPISLGHPSTRRNQPGKRDFQGSSSPQPISQPPAVPVPQNSAPCSEQQHCTTERKRRHPLILSYQVYFSLSCISDTRDGTKVSPAVSFL